MKNIRIVREYIKESINENILGDDIELSYADHLDKLKRTHWPSIEDILRKNIYSRGTSMHKFFNGITEGYSMSELGTEGALAGDDILEYLPAVPYTEDGLNERIDDMVRDEIEKLLDSLIKLTRRTYHVNEGNVYRVIRRTATSIANEWALTYLKKKKVETDYISAEDPAQQIIDNLNLESHSEQVQSLIDLFVSEYYENVGTDPETALQDLKDNLGFYVNTENSVK